jgi:DNA-binding PadR family transcriptional regulator
MNVKNNPEIKASFGEIPRVSKIEMLILGLLVDAAGKELYGLEMIERSAGKLKRGSIYVVLQRMAEKGYVESREEARPAPEIGIPRRLYSITGLGKRLFVAGQAAREAFLQGLQDA